MKWFLYGRRWIALYFIILLSGIFPSLLLSYYDYTFRYFDLYIIIFLIVVIINFLPTLLFSIVGLFRTSKKNRPKRHVTNKIEFMVIVPAYNEKEVILNSVNSLLKQKNGVNHEAQVIVAFNGVDDTGRIAKEAGANVITTSKPKCGKSTAIEYVFAQTVCNPNRYVVIIDADNIVSDTYLAELALSCQSDKLAYQTNHQPLITSNNWMSKGLQAAYNASSRLFNEGRSKLLGSALLCGTGMVLKEPVIRELWSFVQTQTEDIELNGLLSIHYSVGVEWVDEAVFYDEKPDRIDIAIRQRVRWMVGHSRCAYHYSYVLLKKAIVRRSWRDFELALYYLVPISLLASTLWLFLLIPVAIAGYEYDFNNLISYIYITTFVFLVYMFMLPALGYYLINQNLSFRQRISRASLYSLYAMVFALLAWPVAILIAAISLNSKGWIFHTPHKASTLTHEPTKI